MADNKKGNLTDPADEGKEQREQDELEEELKKLDPENTLSLKEIGSMPQRVETRPHPFNGYTFGRKVKLAYMDKGERKLGTRLISTTHIVILKDDNIFEDPSGRNVSHAFFKKDKNGEDIKLTDADGKFKPAKIEKTRTISIPPAHNRIEGNYDQDPAGPREDVVFNRLIEVEGRDMVCAFIPSHSVRAQVCMRLEKGKPKVDPRYMLADPKQSSRLAQVFQNVKYQQLKGERDAQKFDAEPESPAP